MLKFFRYRIIPKGAQCLFFFITLLSAKGQEIYWKGSQLQSGANKIIDGEISIRTARDTISGRRAIVYKNPKRAVLQGSVALKKDGSIVTGDSAIYYPDPKLARVAGNAVIRTRDGDIFAESFLYHLKDRMLYSESPVRGQAKGIRFQADRGVILPNTGNIKLFGRAEWENDSVKGIADTIILEKSRQVVQMSRNAKIIFKNKADELNGRYIEIDLQANRISRIEGSEIRQQDMRVKAKSIQRQGDDYDLEGNVKIHSADSLLQAEGEKAKMQKDGMTMQGQTISRIRDKQGMNMQIYAPQLWSKRKGPNEEYHFYSKTHLRGSFNGFADSLKMEKKGNSRHIFLYRNGHIQNDSLYLEADTIEIFQDSIRERIVARRNAMVVMKPSNGRVNVITAARIIMEKSDSLSEMHAENETESWFWNEEKGNIGLNHTTAPYQKAQISGRKVSNVRTKGNSTSGFQPLKMADKSYLEVCRKRILQRYEKDALGEFKVIPPLKSFLPLKIGKKKP